MSFALASASSMQRVFRDRPFDGPVGTPLELSAAMNGWTSGQVVIMAGEKRLRNVRVDVKDLKSWEVSEDPVSESSHALVEGPPIPGAAFKVSKVHYVEIEWPSSGKTSRPGWYPDPLEPLTAESRFEVEPGMVQPIWLALKVPPDTRARNKSLYRRWYRLFRGSVVVHADVEGEGPQSVEIDIELRVFKFSLPRQRILRLWTMGGGGGWTEFYNWLSPEEVHEHVQRAVLLLASYGIASGLPEPPRAEGEPPDLDYFERFYKKVLDLGVSHLQIHQDTWPVIVKNGWEDIAYRYVAGEWPRETLIERAKDIRKNIATIPLVNGQAAGIYPSPYLEDLVKVWVYPSDESSDSLKERLAQGDEVHWYSCCRPEAPYANCQLDSGQIEPRILGWQLFQYNISGYLYWNAMHVAPHGPNQPNTMGDTPEEKWPNRPWCPNTVLPYSHNDGLIVYPGPGGEPWSSIRLENLRDGADDYDYLCILRDYVAKLNKADFSPELVDRAEQALKVNPDVSACKTEYTKDPAVVERERRRIGSYIEEARATLGEIGPIFPAGFSSEE